MLLVVIIGRSGTGKSTFIKSMNLPDDCHCILSQPLVDEIRRSGQPLDHDNIHSLAKQWYTNNQWWQLEYLLNWVEGKNLVVVDGLRYVAELQKLKKLFPNNLLVIKIISTSDDRFTRLKVRGKIPLTSRKDFDRLDKDETEEMRIEEILNLADSTVENFFTIRDLQKKAIAFGNILIKFL